MSTGAIEPLVIPVRIDPAAAQQALSTVGEAGKKAGDEVAAGLGKASAAEKRLLTDTEIAERAKRLVVDQTNRERIDALARSIAAEKKLLGATEVAEEAKRRYIAQTNRERVAEATATLKAANATGTLRDEMASLIRMQIGLGALKQAADAIGSAFKETSEYIGKTSQEFQKFRESLSGVASLSSRGATNAFATEEIDRAQRAHVTPAEMKEFREAFLSRASLYVGNGPQAKMSEEDAGRLQEYLAEYAKQKGVGQGEMASFAGGLLAQQKGPISLEAMKERVGKTFATLEASSAPVSHLLPAMTRVMAQGFSAEEASRTLAAMPEVAPEEEGSHLLRVIAEMRRNVGEGKGEPYGIKEGMSQQEQLETLVAHLRQQSGGDARKLDALLREFTHEDIAANTLRGMVNQVDFSQWRRVQRDIKPGQLDETIAENRRTETGRQMALDSRLAVERARLGLRNDELERRREIAEAELTAGGQFDRPNLEAAAKALLPGSDKSARSILINQQMIRRARAELGEGASAVDAAAALNRGATDALLRGLLPRIREQEESGGTRFTRFRRAAEEEGVDLDAMAKLDRERREAQMALVRRREIADTRAQLGQGAGRGDERAAGSQAETDRLMTELLGQIAENTRKAPDARTAPAARPGGAPAGRPLVVPTPVANGGPRQ